MSAFSKDPTGRLVSIATQEKPFPQQPQNQAQQHAPSPLQYNHQHSSSPALTQVSAELNSLKKAARRLEEILSAARPAEEKRYYEELLRLQTNYGTLFAESTEKQKDLLIQNERLRFQIRSLQEKEEHYRKELEKLSQYAQNLHFQAKSRESQFQNAIKSLQLRCHETQTEAESLKKALQSRDQNFKKQMAAMQEGEATLRHQLSELAQSFQKLQNGKNTLEIDLENFKSQLSRQTQREQSLRKVVQELESKDKLESGELFRAKKEVDSLRAELNRCRAESNKETQVQEVREQLTQEKQKMEALVEALQIEKSEKQMALTQLHSAEARLSHVSRELQTLQDRAAQISDVPSLDLDFGAYTPSGTETS